MNNKNNIDQTTLNGAPAPEKPKKAKNAMTVSAARALRAGGYSVLITLAVIGVAIFINLLVGKIPTNYTQLDTSTNQLYSVSDASAQIVKAINEDVDVYMIASESSADSVIRQLVEKYCGLNSHIKLTIKDPALYPNFVSQYTTASLSASSLIFVSAKRSTAVDYNDIYVTSYGYDSSYNITTSTSFDGEARITSALQFVTTDAVPVVYTLTGHGESDFTTTLSGYIKDDNYDLQTLNLLTGDAASKKVPEDADCVVINMPTSDISADELTLLETYLQGGGHLVVVTSMYNVGDQNLEKVVSGDVTPNLDALAAYYGLTLDWGLVVEGSSNNYYSYPYMLMPNKGSHAILSDISSDNLYVLMPYATGITVMDTLPRATLSVTPLLVTSKSAYCKLGDFDSVEKSDADVAGSYALAVAAEEGDTRVVWLTSEVALNDSIDQIVSGGNSKFFLSALKWTVGTQTASVSIAAKSTQVAALSLTETQKNVWAAVMIGVIPAAIFGFGISRWFKRRKS